jgi:peroxiredoxin
MRGWVKYTLEDEAGADAEFGTVLDKWKSDPKYVPKALERRAVVRRSQLQTAAAIADLQRYAKEYPKGDEIESVKRYLQYCERFEKPAPPLATEAWIQGDPMTLDAFRGDIVVLYFFATWCENCEAVRPAMLDLFGRYEPMGVHFIGIVDHSKGQTLESVQAFLQPKGIRFPVMMDSASKTIGAYMGTKLPDVVILDRAGRVRWHDNPNNLHDATLELLLVEDPAAAPAKPAK